MQKKVWFKAKSFGWGWYPVSWQGWILTLLYVFTLLSSAFLVDPKTHSASDFLINFAPRFVILTTLLIAICWMKGEKPEWRWNWPPENNNS